MSLTFLYPKPIPAAIRKPIPPSIGIHGGGQQGGCPATGGPPWAIKPTRMAEVANIVIEAISLFVQFMSAHSEGANVEKIGRRKTDSYNSILRLIQDLDEK